MTHPDDHPLIGEALDRLKAQPEIVREMVMVAVYGSRVRSTSTPTSDLDIVVFHNNPVEPGKETRSVVDGLDILSMNFDKTKNERWALRELCAVLSDPASSLWFPAVDRPDWVVDWDAIIKEKARRTSLKISAYTRAHYSQSHSVKVMPHQIEELRRIRRWATRVYWMQKKREVPSTPEIDRFWESLPWKQRDAIIEFCGGRSRILGDIDAYSDL